MIVEPPTIELRPERSLRGRVRLVALGAAPVAVGPSAAPLEREMDETAEEMRRRHAGKPPSEIADLAPARELYRAFGIDPTKTRPSSEALLRRLLRGNSFPRILNAVDLANLLAVRFLLPIGLYDADTIESPVTLRVGVPGESYAGIRKAAIHLEGRPVLVDRGGPFGNPTSDSSRSAVSPETRTLWMVVFAPRSTPRELLADHLEQAAGGITRHLARERDAPRCAGEILAG